MFVHNVRIAKEIDVRPFELNRADTSSDIEVAIMDFNDWIMTQLDGSCPNLPVFFKAVEIIKQKVEPA